MILVTGASGRTGKELGKEPRSFDQFAKEFAQNFKRS